MMTRKELKQLAQKQLSGNLGMLVVCTLIVYAITFIASYITTSIPILSLVSSFILTPPLSLGLIKVYLYLTYGERPEAARVFDGFHQFGASIVLYLLTGLFTFLWSLLFVIPGIMKAYSYFMGFYILADHPEMTGREALRESKAIMKGHRWELFVLQLSFMPWILLLLVALFIISTIVAFIYQALPLDDPFITVIPVAVLILIVYSFLMAYINLTTANFYNQIKGHGMNAERNHAYNGYDANASYNNYNNNSYNNDTFSSANLNNEYYGHTGSTYNDSYNN